jgi:CubicO group peptidase (beta-lactamase class C family)
MAEAQLNNSDIAGLSEFLRRIRHEARVPGLTVSLRTAQSASDLCVGFRDLAECHALSANSVFEIGCAAKLLLAVATFEQARLGKLSLSEPLGAYAPELRHSHLGRQVRLSHLLSHSSGYHGLGQFGIQAAGLDWAELSAYLRRAPLFFEPGAVINYEQSETALLGRILETVSGSSCAQLIRQSILEPLSLSGSGADTAGRHVLDVQARSFVALRESPPARFWQPSFELSLSSAGLADIGAALIGLAGVASPLSSAGIGMRSSSVALPPMLGAQARALLPMSFGLGVARLHDGWLGASGVSAGQCVALRFHPQLKAVVAVAVNAFAPQLRDGLLQAVCVALSAAGTDADVAVRPLPCSLEALEGDYLGGGGSRVSARYASGRLQLEVGAGPGSGTLLAELALGEDGLPRLLCAHPGLCIGVLPPHVGDGLMVGLSAFRRQGLSAQNAKIGSFQ